MNDLSDILFPPALHLVDWSLRWGLIIVLLGLGLAMFSPRRVATRLLLCRLVLAGGLVLPLLPHYWGPIACSVPISSLAASSPPRFADPMVVHSETPLAPTPARVLPVAQGPVIFTVAPDREHNTPTSETTATPIGRGRALGLAMELLWFAGVVLLTGQLVLGWIRLSRLRRSASSVGPAALEMLERCREELVLHRQLDLRTHPAVHAPILVGGVRPAILVPPNWDALPAEHRRAALLHELTHLAHWDDWARAGEEMVRALFFFHPLVRWLLSRLDGEREQLCDAVVVQHGMAPRQLARVLLDFAKQLGAGRSPVAVGAALPFLSRITVKDRIDQLLEDDMTRWITPLSRGQRAALAAAVLGFMVALGGFTIQARTPEDKPTLAVEESKEQTKSAEVNGTVQDEADRPVSGATVVLHRIMGHAKPAVTQTDADGKFRFASLPGDQPNGFALIVAAGKEGLAPARGHAGWEGHNTLSLHLTKTATVHGRVRDQEGRAIVGARVQFGTVERHGNGASWGYVREETLRGTPLGAFFCTRTDAEGKFQIATAPAGQELVFRATADGFADMDTSAGGPKQQHFAKPDAPPVTLVLAPEARVRGQIVNQVPGVIVEGLWVRIHRSDGKNPSFGKQVCADASGRFTFAGLPDGNFTLQLELPADNSLYTLRSAPSVTLHSRTTAAVEMELIEGVVVEGRVVTSESGKPVAGAEVGVYGPAQPKTSHSRLRVETDRNGRYRFRLPPGRTEFFLLGLPKGFSAGPRDEQLRSVVIPGGVGAFSGPTLTVVATTPLAGRVVDMRGRPVPQAEIIGLCRAGTCTRLGGPKVTTDADGRFQIDHGPQGAFMLGDATAFQVKVPGGNVFEVSIIAAKDQVELRLPTISGTEIEAPQDVQPNDLAGVVVDEKGQPLEGVHVHVWDWVDRPENQAHTGKDGIFRIRNCGRNQKVEVRFRKAGYSPVLFVQQPTGVKDLVVAMDSKTYFEGVVHGPDGKPAANALIRADQGPKGGDGVIITSIWTDTRTDASGHYRLYVEPDAYTFLVKAPGVGVAHLPKTPIAHGQVRPFDIQLEPGITFRAVTVDATTGQPVAGVRLWHWQHKDVEGRSDSKGEVAIPEMLPGRFEFSVEAAGYTRWWSEEALSEWNRRQLSMRPGSKWQRNFDYLDFDVKPNGTPVKIVLEKGVHITGRVLDPDGKPVGGATVAPALTGTGNSVTGDTRFSVQTKPDGTFEMLLPASGKAEYNLVAHDGKYQEWREWANGVLPPIQTTPGMEIKDVILTLTRPATVRGKVVDARGKPVADRKVRAHAADKLENRYYDPTTTTQGDGTFELRFIRPGEHFIQAAPFWLIAEEAPGSSTRRLRLAAGETVEAVELVGAEPRP
ncbi:MAG TPA: carboxypeptidase regulatory-like domain-containing protein [Gemmataceae bacterium]|nr:carboxypeptidase regulatory-like domain-containing protein [Gemmataceae bacterium]